MCIRDSGVPGAVRVVVAIGVGAGAVAARLGDLVAGDGAADGADHRAFGAGAVAGCLLYTSDAADERSSVDLGGPRIIKKKKHVTHVERQMNTKII